MRLSVTHLSVATLEGTASPFSEANVGNERDGKCLEALERWQIEGIRQIVLINNDNHIDRASKAHLVKCNIRRCFVLLEKDLTVGPGACRAHLKSSEASLVIINLVGNGSEQTLHIEYSTGGELRCLIPGGLRHWAAGHPPLSLFAQREREMENLD